jgi:hypothetical protein
MSTLRPASRRSGRHVPPRWIASGTVSARPARRQSESQPRVWLVLGDKEGHNAQVHAIERALGWSCEPGMTSGGVVARIPALMGSGSRSGT